jgi:hypothetical protein
MHKLKEVVRESLLPTESIRRGIAYFILMTSFYLIGTLLYFDTAAQPFLVEYVYPSIFWGAPGIYFLFMARTPFSKKMTLLAFLLSSFFMFLVEIMKIGMFYDRTGIIIIVSLLSFFFAFLLIL